MFSKIEALNFILKEVWCVGIKFGLYKFGVVIMIFKYNNNIILYFEVSIRFLFELKLVFNCF